MYQEIHLFHHKSSNTHFTNIIPPIALSFMIVSYFFLYIKQICYVLKCPVSLQCALFYVDCLQWNSWSRFTVCIHGFFSNIEYNRPQNKLIYTSLQSYFCGQVNKRLPKNKSNGKKDVVLQHIQVFLTCSILRLCASVAFSWRKTARESYEQSLHPAVNETMLLSTKHCREQIEERTVFCSHTVMKTFLKNQYICNSTMHFEWTIYSVYR